MHYTNKSNLPEPLFRAVTNDPYSSEGCDYSTTTLIKPPRIVALERQHQKELTEDASDRIWSLIGQIGHLVLERSAMKEIAEKRFFAERLSKKIGGQVDLLSETRLIDYKLTSHYAAKDGVKPEWEQQHNINALLCRDNGIQITSAEIVAIYRDWSVGEARRNSDYPQTQVQVFPVKLWPVEHQELFIKSRLEVHMAAEKELPLCSPIERWARPEKWALMKEGNKRATSLHDSEDEAYAALKMARQYVEHRPGINVRCTDYCAVGRQGFCSWWNDYQKAHPEAA